MEATKKHPRGLYVLFFTEAGERNSYYGNRALLVLYMLFLFQASPEQLWGFSAIKGFLEFIFGPLGNQALSSQIYGLYSGFCYLTPVFGGMIADRWLGQRKSVLVGGVMMAIGHLVIAMQTTFFLGILLLILGNGMFKPNISTQVGALYPNPDDPRRDKAFGIFYMGINLGAMLAPVVCGTLGQKIAWHWGFIAASAVMVLSLIIYLWGQKDLAPDNVMKTKAAGGGPVEPLTRNDWSRIIALCVLCALNIPFWAIYEQQGNTMQIWADQQTVWPSIFGWTIPSTWFQLFNPLMIIAGIPLVNILWDRQNRRGKEPSTVAKMAIGCFLLGSSYIIMAVGANLLGDAKGSIFWLFSTTLFLTLGEIYLSPTGLSLVTKIAPARLISFMMGMWFLSSFFGNYLCGFIGSYYERMPRTNFFIMLTAIGLLSGFGIMAFSKPLKKAMASENPPAA
ncbi:MAG: peptide MFS transporter [Myxococcales bacterium]|nr:peptide MFS transporter [Myxococcales bacterium]